MTKVMVIRASNDGTPFIVDAEDYEAELVPHYYKLAGWDNRNSLFLGGMMCISSTMIVARVLTPGKSDAGVTENAFGILIVQDIAAIVGVFAIRRRICLRRDPSSWISLAPS